MAGAVVAAIMVVDGSQLRESWSTVVGEVEDEYSSLIQKDW
jgi:hypothetical protein